MAETLFERRRRFVNREVAIKLEGKKGISQSKINKTFRQAWKKARKEIKWLKKY